MLIYKSKLRFFGLRAPNQKPLQFKLLTLRTDSNYAIKHFTIRILLVMVENYRPDLEALEEEIWIPIA
jgi:hypothetical protein